MARLAFRRPPAIKATNTVAAQKIMATTDSIVMNSNISVPPSGIGFGLIFALFRTHNFGFTVNESFFQFQKHPGDQGYHDGRRDEYQSDYGHCHHKFHHCDFLLFNLGLGFSFIELEKNITRSDSDVKRFFEKNCTRANWR